MLKIEDEVNACFRENPDLHKKSLMEIARFFMVQGELRYSLLRETMENKANFYAMRLRDVDKEAYAKAKEKWNEAAEFKPEQGAEDKIGCL
jgi:hypothetical protein